MSSIRTASSSEAEREGEVWCVQLVVGEGHVVAGVVLQVEGVLAGNEDDPAASVCCSCQLTGRQASTGRPLDVNGYEAKWWG